MTPGTVVDVCARLYIAAGRTATPVEYAVWEEALEDLTDDLALEVARVMIRNVDLTDAAPSPAVYRSALLERRRRARQEQPALSEPAFTAEERAANQARLRRVLDELRARQRTRGRDLIEEAT